MFTVGIFTTHIPYIIFTACFAWIFLFGVGNENPDEPLTSENQQINNVYVVPASDIKTVDAFYFDLVADPEAATFYCLKHPPVPKEIYPEIHKIVFRSTYFSTQLFNRPPPLV